MNMNKIVFSGLEEYSPEDLFRRLPSPSYVIDETQLECNGFCLLAVAERTGCKVLLAQKAFSNYNFYPLLEPYLAGTEASGLYEARLGKEEMGGKEVHVFCAAYREDEFDELLEYADHIVFNSPGQLKASDFGSTRNVLHRTDMTYMIRVLRAADWEQHANSGIKK